MKKDASAEDTFHNSAPSLLIGMAGYPWCTLSVSHSLQIVLESGPEARIVQIGLSAVFDRVNHHRILYKLCSVRIGGCLYWHIFYHAGHNTFCGWLSE